MNLVAAVRRRLGELLLRGWLLDWWMNRKIRRLEHAYIAELVRRSRGKPATQPARLNIRRQPRRILFISDVQWEGKELVPELRKICPVDTLNLHEQLLGYAKRGIPPAQATAEIVDDCLKSSRPADPDVVLFYARPALLSDDAFRLLRQAYSCPVLGLNLDDKVQFLKLGAFSDGNDGYEAWARHFDLNITNVRAVVDWYAEGGYPVYYMAEGYHAKTEPPGSNPDYQHEISFVGSWRAERAQLHRQLRSQGVPLEMFGFGWPRAKEGLDPEKIYRSSMVTLGIGFASPSRSLTTLKTRDFECPGAGACYLTTYNWELALHYDIGKEILCYRSVEEIVELFSYYRRRPADCWRIAQAAYRRCLHEHTWEKRFEKLFADTAIAS